jgi:hypothetical protein
VRAHPLPREETPVLILQVVKLVEDKAVQAYILPQLEVQLFMDPVALVVIVVLYLVILPAELVVVELVDILAPAVLAVMSTEMDQLVLVAEEEEEQVVIILVLIIMQDLEVESAYLVVDQMVPVAQ